MPRERESALSLSLKKEIEWAPYFCKKARCSAEFFHSEAGETKTRLILSLRAFCLNFSKDLSSFRQG